MPSEATGKKLRFSLMLGVGIVLFGLILSRLSFSELVQTLKQTCLPVLLISWALYLCLAVLRAWRITLFLPAGRRFALLWGVFSVARIAGAVFPFRTGEVALVTMLKKYRFGRSISAIAPVWAWTKIADAFALAIWFIAIVAVFGHHSPFVEAIKPALLIGIGLFAVLVLLLLSPLRTPVPTGDGWVSSRLRTACEGAARVRQPTLMVRSLTVSLIIWGILVAGPTLSQIAFRSPLDWSKCLVASAMVTAVSLLPIHAPLQLGTAEVLWVATMMSLGASEQTALSIAFCLRVNSTCLLFLEGTVGVGLLAVASRQREILRWPMNRGNSGSGLDSFDSIAE
jgi:uncharacterized membrane protein YbhN (UPF0104 family)